MIELLATSPSDGWAFVSEGGQTFLVRPPYTSQTLLTVKPGAIAEAITKHGFQPCVDTFPTWSDLIAYLRDCVRSAVADLFPNVDAIAVATDLVTTAPLAIVDKLLDRVDRALSNGQSSTASGRLLTQAMSREDIRLDTQRYQRALSLLNRALSNESAHQTYFGELLSVSEPAGETELGLAAGTYDASAVEAYAGAVRDRHHLLVFAA